MTAITSLAFNIFILSIKQLSLRRIELIDGALMANKEYICSETQALSLVLKDKVTDGKVIEMDDQELILKIEI